MKTIILIAVVNLSTSCNEKKAEIKTMNNDKQLISIVDSLSKKDTVKETTSLILKDTLSKNKNIIEMADEQYEDIIEKNTSDAFAQKKPELFDKMIVDINDDEKMPIVYKKYWITYVYYKQSILYRGLKNNDKASKAIDKAIENLKDNLKNSEDYALYAACTSFSIQFANMTQLGSIAAEVQENAQKSLELDPKNVRAYYVLASQNFYTPKMFGGMTKVEEYGIKGIACPMSKDEAFYSPYWGKVDLYRILMKYYETEKKTMELQKINGLAKKEFPSFFK
ncbi:MULTISPECIES: hypothetical protein [unclassified Chryseobacterium]|uniref:hypothetical protein n=1 Tax=unclassified Chryseobacterium TaxID=2593645 RepID=UPI000F4F4764|nr:MULTISPECIES: hypothetical protein [unclassified Chryseobacterium]